MQLLEQIAMDNVNEQHDYVDQIVTECSMGSPVMEGVFKKPPTEFTTEAKKITDKYLDFLKKQVGEDSKQYVKTKNKVSKALGKKKVCVMFNRVNDSRQIFSIMKSLGYKSYTDPGSDASAELRYFIKKAGDIYIDVMCSTDSATQKQKETDKRPNLVVRIGYIDADKINKDGLAQYK